MAELAKLVATAIFLSIVIWLLLSFALIIGADLIDRLAL